MSHAYREVIRLVNRLRLREWTGKTEQKTLRPKSSVIRFYETAAKFSGDDVSSIINEVLEWGADQLLEEHPELKAKWDAEQKKAKR